MWTSERIATTCRITAFACIISALASCTTRPYGHHASFSPTAPAPPANTVLATTDVNALLPLSSADLTTAVRLATGFAATYATYRYDETPQSYLARLRPTATPELFAALSRTAATPASNTERRREREAATAQAIPAKLRALAPDSLILILDVRQVITNTTGTRRSTQHLAVTAVKANDGTWAISDIQPATVGDQGDTPDAAPN
jgi:hypothetical protein